MLVAIDQNGEKLFAFRKDKKTLRVLSEAKELYCPNCQKQVFFR